MDPHLPLPAETGPQLDVDVLRAGLLRDDGRGDGAVSSSTPPRREATDEDVRRAIEIAESAPVR